MTDDGAARGRRELALAIGCCVVAGAVVLIAAGRHWVSYAVSGGGHASSGPTGHDVASGASALGVVMLAAAVALPATRRWLRRGVGVIVAAAGAGTIGLAAYVLADPGDAAGKRLIGFFALSPNPTVSVRATGWPWADICAGVLALLAGAFALLRSGNWPAMGRRYESGGRKRAGAASAETSMWDRLDQGDDPTV
jgi:uncharacterized membrane protein (TIGR02234 family)